MEIRSERTFILLLCGLHGDPKHRFVLERGAGWALAAEEFEKTAAVTRPENLGLEVGRGVPGDLTRDGSTCFLGALGMDFKVTA